MSYAATSGDENQENNPVIAFFGALFVSLGRPAINRPGDHATPRQRGWNCVCGIV